MRLKNRFVGLGLGVLLVVAVGSAYVAKHVYCPPVSDDRSSGTNYVGVVYEGPPQRLEQAIRDYHLGKIQYIMPSGGVGINGMRQHAIESGVPESRIILPDSSRDTFENVTTSSRAIEENGLINSRRHYGGEKQIPRNRMIVERLAEDPEKDDAYVPVEDGYSGRFFGIPNLREALACTNDIMKVSTESRLENVFYKTLNGALGKLAELAH